jgi:hypothetical protein
MKYLIAITLSLTLVTSASTNARSHSRVAQKFRSGISGRITDPNGAVVVGAKITIVSRSSNASVSRSSNDEGQYVTDLDPDVYDVFVDANGFKKAKRKSIPVEREGRNYVDFVLELPDDVIRQASRGAHFSTNNKLDASGASVFRPKFC